MVNRRAFEQPETLLGSVPRIRIGGPTRDVILRSEQAATTDREIVSLSNDIVKAQEREIAQMADAHCPQGTRQALRNLDVPARTGLMWRPLTGAVSARTCRERSPR